MKILAFAGSLRKNSYNKKLLQAAANLLPETSELEIVDISEIPLYNQDQEEDKMPASVGRLKQRIQQADAVLIATPEYNHSYPGVLKNVIDWVSRPYGNNSFSGKPAAVVSASPGLFGGVRAQDQLKQVLIALNMQLVTQPAVIVSSANQKFGEDGDLTDADAKRFMKQLLQTLVELTRRLNPRNQLATVLPIST